MKNTLINENAQILHNHLENRENGIIGKAITAYYKNGGFLEWKAEAEGAYVLDGTDMFSRMAFLWLNLFIIPFRKRIVI